MLDPEFGQPERQKAHLERAVVAHISEHIGVRTKNCFVNFHLLVAASDLKVAVVTIVPQSKIS
jgi:hypothetical protein